MSVDAKSIQLFLWKIIRFSVNTSYKCVQEHPLVSGVLLFMLLLYVFLPSLFFLLMYSSPVLVGTAILVRSQLNSKKPKIQNAVQIEKKDSEKPSMESAPSFRTQKSVRRNVRKDNIELDSQVAKLDRDIVSLIAPTGNSIVRKMFDEKPTSITQTPDHGESSSNVVNENIGTFDDQSLPFERNGFGAESEKVTEGGGEAEVDSSEEGEDEDEEEVRGGGNKAVEWTEDDQKNLMDLGISELERNKRLESLIAKRRARKFFKMAIEKSLLDMETVPPGQIAPICVSKGNPFDVPKSLHEEGLQMPGSAPSVLLTTRNPFDLPYDPQEEKPNLTGDSFQEEFMAAQQKDIFFCRHESFCRGPFFPFDPKYDLHSAPFGPYSSVDQERVTEEPGYFRFGRRSADKEGCGQQSPALVGSVTDLVELESSSPSQAVNSMEPTQEQHRESDHNMEQNLGYRSEIQMDMDSVKNDESSSSPSSSEASETTVDREREAFNDHAEATINIIPTPKRMAMNRASFDSILSPSSSEKPRLDDRLFFTESEPCHTPTYSIASDMQVEVSEIGSPPYTVDGTASSSADEDSLTYDGDIEKDATSGSEELWRGLFYRARGEENGRKLRELEHISEEEIVEEAVPNLNRKQEDLDASSAQSERETKSNLNGTSSSISRREVTENRQPHGENINHGIHENGEQIANEFEFKQSRTSNVSSASAPENLENRVQLVESDIHSSSEVYLEKLEGSPEAPKKHREDMNAIYDVEPAVQVDLGTSESKIIGNRDHGAQILVEQEALMDPKKQGGATKSESGKPTNHNLETSYEHQAIMKSEKMTEDPRNGESDPENLPCNAEPGNVEDEMQDKGILQSSQESKDKQEIIPEVTSSGVEERFIGLTASAIPPRLVAEHISINSGSFSSPRSVLLGEIPMYQSSETIDIDVPQSVMEVESKNLLDEEQHELTSSKPQDPENPVDSTEGPSKTTVKSTEESSTMHTNKPVFNNMESENDSSIQSTGESETQIICEDAEDLLKPEKESLTNNQDCTDPSTSEDEKANPSVLKSTVKEEESTNSTGKFVAEANVVKNINDSLVIEKEEEEKLKNSLDESQFSIEPGANSQNGKSMEHEGTINPSKTEVIKGDQAYVSGKATKGKLSEADIHIIQNANELGAGQMTNKENSNDVADGESETQILSRQEAVVHSPKATEEVNARSNEDAECQSKRPIEDESNDRPSKSVGESKNKDVEESGRLTSQESIESPKPGDDGLKPMQVTPEESKGLPVADITMDKLADNETSVEPPKRTESEIKAVNQEANTSTVEE